jgi:hypothetical protein
MRDYNENLIKWACEEVDKQGESALAVVDFLTGWWFIHDTPYPLEQTISVLNGIVRGWPTDQAQAARFGAVDAYRTTPVTFINGNTGAKADQIPRLMNQLCDSDLWEEDRTAFVLEFLKIHPFEDGNGRMAAMMVNKDRRFGPSYWPREFNEVPSMDGWDEGYGSAVEVVDFEDDKPSRERPVLKMRDVTEINT